MINLLQDPIPKPLLWAGVPIAALILIVLFSFLRFPYDDFRPVSYTHLTLPTIYSV